MITTEELSRGLPRPSFPLFAALLSALLALVVLVGWFFDIPALKSVLPGAVQMKANTAIALLLASLSLLLADRQRAGGWLSLCSLAAMGCVLIGLLTMAEYLFGLSLGIDELLFADTAQAFNAIRGRMSPYSAMVFICLGGALLAAPRPRLRPVATLGASLSIAIGAVALLGYLWSAPELITDQWLPPVAVNTAVTFMLLGGGALRMASLAQRRDSPQTKGRVEWKVLTGFVVPLSLFCIAAGVTYTLNVRYGDTSRWVGHSYQVRTLLGKLFATATKAEAIQQAQVEDPQALPVASYKELSSEAGGYLVTLHPLLAGNPVQAGRLDQLAQQLEERFRTLAGNADRLHLSAPTVRERAELRAARLRALASTDTLIDAMDNAEVAAIETRSDELARTRAYTLVALIITLAIATAALLTLFGSIVRELRARERIAEELADAQREMRRATNAKSDFLAAMSHEIRTPMSGVIGMLDLLGQSSLQPHQMEMVQLTRESADALLTIIDDILDFSKIEAGKLELEEVPLSVYEGLQRTCSLMNRIAESKDVTLLAYIDPRHPKMLIGDPYRLQQVMINLINNAIKFSSGLERPGRVQLRASVLEQDVDSVRVEVTVSDNGVGMAPETISRLFAPFTQADSSTTRRYGGTGLGLIICKRLVDLMGGEISVNSQIDIGTTFTVRLTLKRPMEVEGAPAASLVSRLPCAVIGNSGGLVDDVVSYLQAEGAEIRHSADASAPVCVYVSDNVDEAIGQHAANLDSDGNSPSRIVLVTTDRTQLAAYRAQPDNRLVVDGNALKRQSLVNAVAIAAGRLRADSNSCVTGPRRILAPPASREAAATEHRLILAAEDNVINQKVIRQQLNMLGYAVEFAPNGAEALRMWHARDYSLVLTDLHMPEMDGYDLTLAIRVAERGRAHVPIVALSANALPGEAERCQAVGMDDYLTKPATVADLQRVLQRWLPNGEEATASGPAASAPATVNRHVDIDVLRALVDDDASLVQELLHDFQDSAGRAAEALGAACRSGDARDARRWSHNLKSSTRSIGALALGELAERIESAARDEHAALLPGLWQDFEREYRQVLRELQTPDSAPADHVSATGTEP